MAGMLGALSGAPGGGGRAPGGGGGPLKGGGGGAGGGGGGAGGGGGGGDPLGQFSRSELTCLLDVLSALGDRRDPPLTPLQASSVSKLGSVLFAARLRCTE